MQKLKLYISLFLLILVYKPSFAQKDKGGSRWHGKERLIHYSPAGQDFILVNGKKRFNRALYGTNTGFRVETGDLPEFALYMRGMGGNLKFGLISGKASKWLIDAKEIKTRYRPGSMLYEIKDPLLGGGTLQLAVLALADAEGVIIKAKFEGVKDEIDLFWAFGGATGKRFSREGDIGADPESVFYLHPEYCRDNIYLINNNTFQLFYGSGKVLSEEERNATKLLPLKTSTSNTEKKQKLLTGLFPEGARIQLADAAHLESPSQLLQSKPADAPIVTGRIPVDTKDLYWLIQNPIDQPKHVYSKLPALFNEAESARKKLAGRVKVTTPDPYLNTLGAALSIAADAIWETPTFLHGAVAWRMRLNAWRGAYVADPLGWHDRAKLHFSSYAKSQVTKPTVGPVVADTALHLARQLETMGTAMFSSGYISRNPNNNTRPHHYDMNLVFFDQMLNHFKWTGDLAFAKEMWPVLKRHLAWEKRNFDTDGDGLYDAYAAIWASDALQYSGGGVTHTSAYNYRANKIAAQLARSIGEDPKPYQDEADKILKALNAVLWMPEKGWYAEYKDLMGLKLLHPTPGLWTIYHAIDAEVPNPFQAYQTLRYVDTEIPKIPIAAKGLPENDHYTLSTTNWQPYTWSINNVALAEVLQTSLAYWQAGRSEDAFTLWKSNIIESMYLSSSPGGFEQLSFYDAIRGELYRDFADPIGVAARTLVEGLFGVLPDALTDTLTIHPGLPSEWNFASLAVPDIAFDFKRTGNKETYMISPSFPNLMNLRLKLKARTDKLSSVTVNGVEVNWSIKGQPIGAPVIEITAPKSAKYAVELVWAGSELEKITQKSGFTSGEPFIITFNKARILEIYDPQNAFSNTIIDDQKIEANVRAEAGNKTAFFQLGQGQFTWWEPLDFEVKPAIKIIPEKGQKGATLKVQLVNNGGDINGRLVVNHGFATEINLAENKKATINIPNQHIKFGTNIIRFESSDGKFFDESIQNWSVNPKTAETSKVDLSEKFNDKVTHIFKNQYLSPRPASPTLQLPTQGIGNWCYPLTTANIDDRGLRAAAGPKNEIVLPNGIPLSTPSDSSKKNILFTSQWDNYPDSASVTLSGKSSHAYLLMAGSTNPMQSRMDNGEIIIYYKDNSFERLPLKNPENWWPIEQDYFIDDYAFTTDAPRPYRIHLKTGEITRDAKEYYTIKGFSNLGIDGGAATLLDLPLNPHKELKELKLKALTNDVIIGLMSVTLQRQEK